MYTCIYIYMYMYMYAYAYAYECVYVCRDIDVIRCSCSSGVTVSCPSTLALSCCLSVRLQAGANNTPNPVTNIYIYIYKETTISFSLHRFRKIHDLCWIRTDFTVPVALKTLRVHICVCCSLGRYAVPYMYIQTP